MWILLPRYPCFSLFWSTVCKVLCCEEVKKTFLETFRYRHCFFVVLCYYAIYFEYVDFFITNLQKIFSDHRVIESLDEISVSLISWVALGKLLNLLIASVSCFVNGDDNNARSWVIPVQKGDNSWGKPLTLLSALNTGKVSSYYYVGT